MDIIIQIIGWIGALLLLIAFCINIYFNISPKSTQYLTLNLTGSLLLIINALDNKAYPFVLVNVIWMIFSLYKLKCKAYEKKKNIKGSQ